MARAKLPERTGLLLIEPRHLAQLVISKTAPGQYYAQAIFAVFTEAGEVARDHNDQPLAVEVDTKSEPPLSLGDLADTSALFALLKSKAIAKLGLVAE